MLKKLSYLTIVALIVMVGSTNVWAAATLHWTGQASNVWHNPSNWDLGQVPGQDDDAFIDPPVGSPNPQPTFSSASTTQATHSGYFLGWGTTAPRAGTVNMTGGTITIASALRSAKTNGASPQNPVMNMTGGTVNITGIHTTSGAWIALNHGALSWGEACNGGTATWNMTSGNPVVLCGTLQLPAANTNNHAVFNLNAGVLSIREDSYGYGTTEGRGLFIGEDITRSTAGPYDGKLNIGGTPSGTLLCGSDVTGLIDSYVTAGKIVAYPADTTKRRYIVRDWNSRNTGKTTVTAVKQEMGEAYQPSPINGERFAPVTPTLTWSAGQDANSHDVYFGTSTNPPFIQNQLGTSFVPQGGADLIRGQTYYWKIVEKTGNVVGPVWSFTVTGRAKDPVPDIGDTVNPPYNGIVNLSWTAGTDATTHTVYLGTNSAALGAAVYSGGTASTTANPVMGQTYYWRVDETGLYTGTVTGDLWNFIVNPFRMVDDFEAYPNVGALRSKWFFWNPSLGTVDLMSGTLPHHNGAKGMSVNYSLSGEGTEVYTNLDPASQDWTFANTGAKTLTIYMRGSVSNTSLSTLGILLYDAGGDASAQVNYAASDTIVKGEDWIEWNINIDSFATANFDLNAVAQVSIVIDCAGVASADVLYVDDLRLYPSRCVDQTNDIGKADITNDCVVNLNDLDVIVEDWLEADSQAVPNGKFNPNMTTPAFTGWVAGKFGNGAQFNGTSDWMDIDDSALSSFYNKTIAFWLKRNGTPASGQSWYVLGTSNAWRVNISVDSSNTLLARIGSSANQIGNQTIGTSWVHVALTLARDSGTDIVTGKLYINGVFVTQGDSPAPAHYYSYLNGICIGALNNGSAQYGQFAIDDFRIYNSVLTDTIVPPATSSDIDNLADGTLGNELASPAILYAFNEASGTTAAQTGTIGNIYHPLNYKYNDVLGDSTANLFTAESTPPALGQKVNFKDQAKVAKYWLQTISNWP